MTWLQFSADVIKSLTSLAWPAAFAFAVWLFREKLTELMPLLRFKYKEFDISFRLDKAEQEQAKLPAPTDQTPDTPEEIDRFRELAKWSPKAAILELRSDIEEAVRSYADAVGMKGGPVNRDMIVPLGLLIRQLRKNELIDQPTSAILDDLRAIGNSAAHGRGQALTQEDALRFRALAEGVIRQLNIASAAAKMPTPGPIVPGP